ncbi:unnamed protein product, partial [Ceratitis capitata]
SKQCITCGMPHTTFRISHTEKPHIRKEQRVTAFPVKKQRKRVEKRKIRKVTETR